MNILFNHNITHILSVSLTRFYIENNYLIKLFKFNCVPFSTNYLGIFIKMEHAHKMLLILIHQGVQAFLHLGFKFTVPRFLQTI